MDIEEFRKITDDKLIELSDYIHKADITATEKMKRRLELSTSLFVSSLAMNTEATAKRDLVHHIFLLLKSAEETIDMRFHNGTPGTCKITKAKEYKEERNE
jgi:hypothetical protein